MTAHQALEEIIGAFEKLGGKAIPAMDALFVVIDAAKAGDEWARLNLVGESRLQTRTFMTAMRLAAEDCVRLWPSDPPDSPEAKRIIELVTMGSELRDIIRRATGQLPH